MRSTYSYRKMAKPFANSGEPDQTPRSAASDLGLHCLPITLLWVSRLQWVNSVETLDNKVKALIGQFSCALGPSNFSYTLSPMCSGKPNKSNP